MNCVSEVGEAPMVPVYVALDMSDRAEALRLVDKLGAVGTHYKVGLQAYLALGRPFVEQLLDAQKHIFLDLKFHDIPNTVQHAVYEAARMGVDLITVHALGGPIMLQQAVTGLREGIVNHSPNTRLFAVTLLTSMDEFQCHQVGLDFPSIHVGVLHYSSLAHAAGVDGIVCAATEVSAVKSHFASLLTLVPGIRPRDSATDDQRRVATPEQAVAWGADYLVVGRPIRMSADPQAALVAIKQEVEQALLKRHD